MGSSAASPRSLPPARSILIFTSGHHAAAGENPVSFPEWHEILALEPLDALGAGSLDGFDKLTAGGFDKLTTGTLGAGAGN